MSALAGTKADLYVGSRPAVSAPNLATTADAGRLVYSATDRTKRFLDSAQTTTVQTSPDGTTWTTITTGFTVQYVGARVVFAAAQPVGTQVRFLACSYLPITQLGQANKWSVDFGAEILDVATFGSGWKAKVPGMKDASASIDRFWLDEAMLLTVIAGNPIIVAFYTDYANGLRYEGYARLKSVSDSVELGGTVDEALSLEIVGDLFYANTP